MCAACLLLPIPSSGNAGDSPKGQHPGAAIASPSIFNEVQAGSGNEEKCTPPVPRDFIGLAIRAPEVVLFDPAAKDEWGEARPILLCGIYRLNSLLVNNAGNVSGTSKVHMTNLATGEHLQLTFAQNRFMHADPAPDPARRQSDERLRVLANQIETGYFNENIYTHVEIPNTPARYRIFMTYDRYTSNTVDVELRTSTPGPR